MSEYRSTTYDERPYDGRPYDPADDVRAPAWEEAAAASATAVSVPADADAPLAPEAVAGNLRRYARWQWKDYWQRRGFWLAGAALLGVWFLTYVISLPRGDAGPLLAEQIIGMAQAMFTVGGALAGLLGVGGLVARERERGLQRFLFAKPVGITRYYLQGLGVNAVGSLLVVAGAVALAALVVPASLPVLTIFGGAAAAYVLAGGVTFLLSTLVRFDVPVAAGWLVAGFPVIALAENGYRVAQALQWLFPHGWAFQLVKGVFGQGDPGARPELLIALAACVGVVYGLLCLVAGLAVLRRRSIST